jgi:hypothetical protein
MTTPADPAPPSAVGPVFPDGGMPSVVPDPLSNTPNGNTFTNATGSTPFGSDPAMTGAGTAVIPEVSAPIALPDMPAQAPQ